MSSEAGLEYEWDEEKNRANVARSRPDFSEIENFDWDTAVIRESDRFQESRWLAISHMGSDELYAVVFTLRNGRRRIISLRIASNRERREYEQG